MNFHPLLSPQSAAAAPGRIPRRSVPSFSPLAHPHPHSLNHKSPQSSQSPSQTNHSSAGRQPMHDLACKPAGASAVAPIEGLRPPGIPAVIRSIVDTYGVRGLWLGHTGTLLRETGGTASWFVTKEWVARKLVDNRMRTSSDGMSVSRPKNGANAELLPWESAVSGAIAGAVGALMFYPADTVKSAIQTEEELRPPGSRFRRSTFLGTFKKMYRQHGVKGLYAGCGMTVARAVPSSGVIFLVYDGLNAYFS